MTDNKRVTNKQILDKINDLKVGDEGLNLLATKIVSRMVKIKSMETWFDHVSKSDVAWSTSYEDLQLTEEENALGEAAKLMTLMNLFKEDEDAMTIATYLAYKPNGFTTFTMNKWNVARLVYEVSSLDLEKPPQNKLRKIIFKPNCGLDKTEKLKIVGKLIGRLRGVQKEDLYEAMIQTNYEGDKIIISRLAKMLNVTPRTIHRHMCDELKQEKEELNEEINI